MSFVRSSKFRHVFAPTPKREQIFDGVKLTRSAWDSNWVAASSSFIAVAWATGGGGAAGLFKTDAPGRYEPTKVPLVTGHKGTILNMQFDPFNDDVLATCSEDATARIWKLPEGELTTEGVEELQILQGHQKKVGNLCYNPVAEGALTTSSQDATLKVWDIETGTAKLSIDTPGAIVQSLSYNYNGSTLCTNSKDKTLRVYDPRQQSEVASVESHIGVKGGRALFMGKNEMIFTCGFGRGASRGLNIFDMKDLSKPLLSKPLDNGSGPLMPFYDEDSNLVFIPGKGDVGIKYYEIIPEADVKKMFYPVSVYRGDGSTSACASLPRRALEINNNEIIRLYQVVKDKICPLHFKVPRKSQLFADDIFPPCRSDEAPLTSEAWFGGENATPKLKSLEDGFVPKEKKTMKVNKVEEKKELKGAELKKAYEAALKKIDELEKEVASLKQ